MMQRFSILQDSMTRCYVCGTDKNIHIHEVFFGTAHRQISIKYGLCIGLCGYHHNLSKVGIHQNKELDNSIKALSQIKAMQYYNWSLDDWMRIFRRNYL